MRTLLRLVGGAILGIALQSAISELAIAQSDPNRTLTDSPPILTGAGSNAGAGSLINDPLPATGNQPTSALSAAPTSRTEPGGADSKAKAATPASKSSQVAYSGPFGAPVVKEYGDWSTECFSPVVQGVACQIAHRLIVGNGRQIVLAVSMVNVPSKKQTRLVVAFPLGVSIAAGVRLEIGDGFQSDIPLSRCTNQGCLLEGTVTDAMMTALLRNKEAVATVLTEAGAPVHLPISLKGFADAESAMITANSVSEKH